MEFDLKILRGRDIPENLREIPQPPGKLYIAGSLPPQDTVCLAVVGSRKATTYGKDAVKKLISGLKGYKIAIVSGLAVGIDALSHEAALDAGLCAVAFPGSGISEKAFFPPTSLGLAHRIIKAGGCLLSEFEPDFKAQYYSFPMRNRLVAGISKAALIIEAQEKSGTLITARMALDYNKDVLAVPGNINSEFSKGTNKLIRQGAIPITSSDDILEALGFKVDKKSKQQNLFEDARPEEKSVLKILTEPMSRDELIQMMKMPTGEANALLSIMEIKGLIREELGEIRAAF
ncbi:DNA protecting protein DprA [Candidatus Nomurabacteria bacterium RIFCSPHIGHO2_02_FULL_41_18]|uniref:DNA protecting protein DprA n=1 Tax=Candidatus Nomurabacteria bacterium RIFCSPHIGHO2_02_FULL_41_18 TaxID=1801754 RepID=A0A1F6W6U5_9BACT|nr:MAG: DNA protecting protein DprA [Candidatus Nomurabacteria bacterium RIFCSPHIGHO2_01_FULL_41_71]OGI77564.1 MAG: DNA protecting protein DprA [Candidatus Nomurabacteria bacterium RIFCSPHIGHO2_02_FULL_41_18]OGI89064.1 MAG: DNA protecting protein DprA [Candidatus Nomurabacteria bacterium RIFCSPLOWO2_01_FULL_41_52b]OGJ00435.1 MAG: DNA protecting protein DprA [Candidatus Nomurabacteria bacterium RIFCSPLOWO2_02_FULL_41_9]